MPKRIPTGVKDAIVSYVTFENFAEVNTEDFIERPITTVANHEWFIQLKKFTHNEIDYLNIFLYFLDNDNVPGMFEPDGIYAEYEVVLMSDIDRNWLYGEEEGVFVSDGMLGWRKFIPLSRVFAEDGGFLTNGELTVRVRIRADFIIDDNGIRMFNFHDPFEGCVKLKMASGKKTFYVRKEMIMHHSRVLAEQIAAGKEEIIVEMEDDYVINFEGFDPFGAYFEAFLQLIHGVLVELDEPESDSVIVILKYAVDFDAPNIIRLCNTKFLEIIDDYYKEPKFFVDSKFFLYYFKRVLKTVKSAQELQKMVLRFVESECKYIDLLDTEMMKTIVRQFFSIADDSRSLKAFA